MLPVYLLFVIALIINEPSVVSVGATNVPISRLSFKSLIVEFASKKALNAMLPVSSFWIASVHVRFILSSKSLSFVCPMALILTVTLPVYLLSLMALIINEPSVV